MQSFPQFIWGERFFPYNYRFWRGTLQPFGKGSDIGLIAKHLQVQEALSVCPSGKLVPTQGSLEPLAVPSSPELHTQFEIEIVYLEPPNVPRIYALNPRIDPRTFKNHPHINGGRPHPLHFVYPNLPNSDLCVFATQDDAWSWEKHTVADIIEYTSFWLAAHLLWSLSGRREWLIPGASHDPALLLLTTPPQAQCSCGSGRAFQVCCKKWCVSTIREQSERQSAAGPTQLRTRAA